MVAPISDKMAIHSVSQPGMVSSSASTLSPSETAMLKRMTGLPFGNRNSLGQLAQMILREGTMSAVSMALSVPCPWQCQAGQMPRAGSIINTVTDRGDLAAFRKLFNPGYLSPGADFVERERLQRPKPPCRCSFGSRP